MLKASESSMEKKSMSNLNVMTGLIGNHRITTEEQHRLIFLWHYSEVIPEC